MIRVVVFNLEQADNRRDRKLGAAFETCDVFRFVDAAVTNDEGLEELICHRDFLECWLLLIHYTPWRRNRNDNEAMTGLAKVLCDALGDRRKSVGVLVYSGGGRANVPAESDFQPLETFGIHARPLWGLDVDCERVARKLKELYDGMAAAVESQSRLEVFDCFRFLEEPEVAYALLLLCQGYLAIRPEIQSGVVSGGAMATLMEDLKSAKIDGARSLTSQSNWWRKPFDQGAEESLKDRLEKEIGEIPRDLTSLVEAIVGKDLVPEDGDMVLKAYQALCEVVKKL